MDLDLSAKDREFRDEVRTWLEEHVPSDRPPTDLKALREFDLGWQKTQFEGGWAGINWPSEHGGRGLSLLQQLIWYEVSAIVGAPEIGSCFVGMNHAGPTLIARASEAQRSEHLPAILRGDVIWCQGFSEPDAGSDLASIGTRGVVDGDYLVITGQKIWTSYAPIADFQELLVRTGDRESRHRGLTWTICDMSLPGISIRPIPNVHGTTQFAEVFYDEVHIPLANVVDAIGSGWSVAMSTLSFERGTAAIAHQIELARTIEEVVDYAKTATGPDGRRPAISDDEIGRNLALVRAEAAALRSMTYRTVSRAAKDGVPGSESSIIRLYYSELAQRVMQIAYSIEKSRTIADNEGWPKNNWIFGYLDSFRTTIGAGTKDIQRNIIGERVLGLAKGR